MKGSQRSLGKVSISSIWLPVVVLAAIAAESTRGAGEPQTRGLLIACVSRLHLTAYFPDIMLTNMELRKIGHFCGYGLLALGSARDWAAALHRSPRHCWRQAMWRAVPLGIAGSAVVATLDEWHQRYLPGRASSVRDVLLDTAGAIFFTGLYALVSLLNRRREIA